ncbi:hypothetical protein [Bacillus sp. SG-1]|nr:hypothetical protein [Bacillus sp. SG-1]
MCHYSYTNPGQLKNDAGKALRFIHEISNHAEMMAEMGDYSYTNRAN